MFDNSLQIDMLHKLEQSESESSSEQDSEGSESEEEESSSQHSCDVNQVTSPKDSADLTSSQPDQNMRILSEQRGVERLTSFSPFKICQSRQPKVASLVKRSSTSLLN